MPSEHQGGWILWFFLERWEGKEKVCSRMKNYGSFFKSFHFISFCDVLVGISTTPPSRFSIPIFFSLSIQPPQYPPLPLNSPFPLRRPRHALGSRGKVLGTET